MRVQIASAMRALKLLLLSAIWFLAHDCTANEPNNPETKQNLYAPIAGLKDFDQWEIAIVNRTLVDVRVTIAPYARDGAALVPTEIILKGSETRRLDIKQLTQIEDAERSLGGISISYTGPPMGVGAQVTIAGFHGFGNIDVPVFDDMMYKSNNYDALWWEPGDARSYLILGNSSADRVHAQLHFPTGSIRDVDLAAHSTSVEPVPASERHVLQGTSGRISSVHVVGTGMAGTLRVTGSTVSASEGFLATIRAYDPASGTEAAVYANGLHFSDGDTHLLVKNLSINPVKVSGFLYPTAPIGTDRKLAIQEKEVEANGVAELNVPTVSHPDALDGGAIKLVSTGPTGSLISSYTNHDTNNQITRSIPFKDIGDAGISTGG